MDVIYDIGIVCKVKASNLKMHLPCVQSILGNGASKSRCCTRDAGTFCSTSGRHLPEHPLVWRTSRSQRKSFLNNCNITCRSKADVPGEGDDSLDGEKVDIDLLASQLSKEAEKLRRASLASGGSIDLDEEPLELEDENGRSSERETFKRSSSEVAVPGGPFGYEVWYLTL